MIGFGIIPQQSLVAKTVAKAFGLVTTCFCGIPEKNAARYTEEREVWPQHFRCGNRGRDCSLDGSVRQGDGDRRADLRPSLGCRHYGNSTLVAIRARAGVYRGEPWDLDRADLLNLGKIQGLGAPVASIGGAGTFDGIFLTGILAVLLA